MKYEPALSCRCKRAPGFLLELVYILEAGAFAKHRLLLFRNCRKVKQSIGVDRINEIKSAFRAAMCYEKAHFTETDV